MRKQKEYKFTAKDFVKFSICSWPILLMCLICGGCAAAYSYINQKTSFGLSMVLLVHDEKTTISGPVSPYIQIPTILVSPRSYEKIGLSPNEIGFSGITAHESAAGVIAFEGEGADSESIKESMLMIADNAEDVIREVYTDKDHDYEITVLKHPGDEVIEHNTEKERVLSVTIIMILSVFFAIGIDFICFNKKAKVTKE